MTDRELLALLRKRVARKLFAGDCQIERCGDEFQRASDSTSGVGLACFPTGVEQDRAFTEVFKREAIAARPYIYALEKFVIRLLLERKLGSDCCDGR